MTSYLSTTLELRDFYSPLEVTDAIAASGLEATYSNDAIFIMRTIHTTILYFFT